MPRLDLILLPLLAGYIFLVTFNITKYYHLRIEKQRLIYNSLIAAISLVSIVYFVDYYIGKSSFEVNCLGIKPIIEYRTQLSNWIDSLINLENKIGLKQSIVSLIISFPLAKLLNLFFSRKFSFDYTIGKWGNHLERIIWFSITEKNDEDKLLMLTTKNNKVYIGYISRLDQPIGETYLTIIPNLSGYRNKENLKIEITTSYTDVIEKYVIENRESEIGNKLGVIIPISEIMFVSRFDTEIFGRFNEGYAEEKQEKKSLIDKIFSLIKGIF